MKPVPDLTGAQWRSGDPDGTADGGASRVEIAFVDDMIVMRDSKHPDGPVLVFTRSEWDAFLAGAKDNEFDLPG
ncbi:MAG TPA: DUF397 domain-containing protein [Mycobacteriales bacterium]|nr:DUF397 domain-containing protein [Mycobacteriales bacterium]